RTTRVRASLISNQNTLVQAAHGHGQTPFVSPTTSDMSLMYDFPSLKIGPGESARSHSADEFIRLSEIEEAIPVYHSLITGLRL
ncbi:MAG: M20/M25/M40 family metallo-hydrolase, partial [Duncaniella sp.]|nr:M20/M25/M40 family metallo-hydrolase [Duncaniella sp.]